MSTLYLFMAMAVGMEISIFDSQKLQPWTPLRQPYDAGMQQLGFGKRLSDRTNRERYAYFSASTLMPSCSE